MTAAIASYSTQSLTQISFALQTTSSETTAGSSGLAFTGDGATYNGQPIELSDIVNDRSGRFTDAQKQQTRQLQQQREAQSTIAALGQLLPNQSASASQGAALSSDSLQLLNELNAQGGSNGAVTSTLNLSISVTADATANVMAGSDPATVSTTAASAQYDAVINFSAGTTQSQVTDQLEQ
jgi:hypothetical protein